MEKPKVSVIVPVHNACAYLDKCLDTIVNQSLRNIEIICVDDGSSDDSLNILEEYAGKDPRITVITQGNRNAGVARNRGLEIARGEYLAFLDADDFFSRSMLEKCVKVLDEDRSDIVVCAARQYDNELNRHTAMPWSLKIDDCPDHSPFLPEEMSAKLLNSFQTWPWNKVYRKSLIDEHELVFQDISRSNDVAFVVCALALAGSISVCEEPFVYYRVNTGTSLQQTNSAAPLAFWDAYSCTREKLAEYGIYESYKQSFINLVLSGLMYNLRSVKGTPAYNDVLDLVRYRAEDEYHFLDYPIDYYHYGASAVREYCAASRRRPRQESYPVTVSVVIPTLNSAKYVSRCIESVLTQNMEEIEIICVDGGSDDDTPQILERYAAQDPRVRVLTSDMKSYGRQMNLGIDAARGKYLGIVESDDYILPGMYKSLSMIADRNFAQVIKADYQLFYEIEDEERWIFRPILNSLPLNYYNRIIDAEVDLRVFEASNVPWAGLYEIDFLRGHGIRFNETPGASYQDNGFWFQVFSHAKRVYFSKQVFYSLRQDNPKSSVFSKEKVFCMCEEYDFVRKTLSKDPQLEEKYASRCALYRFKNYEWTSHRVAEEHKIGFLKRFAQDFQAIIDRGELDEELYTTKELERLYEIVEDPVGYYYSKSKLTYEFLRFLPPDRYEETIKRWYLETMGEEIDIENPTTFNEKTQWLKLYASTPEKTRLADKYLVRDYISEKIGDEYLIPLIGVYDDFDSIDIDALPDKFVIKANHGCGWNIIVDDKNEFDIDNAREQCDKWMHDNWALHNGLELHYFGIEPKILIEEYLENNENDLHDYKVFCFNGKAASVMYLCERKLGLKMAFYDLNWNKLPYVYSFPQYQGEVPKPKNLDLLIELAEKLAEGFEFARVDFYILNDGSLKFGEITFTSGSGQCRWDPPSQNEAFGRLLQLPSEKLALPTKSFAERGCGPQLEKMPVPEGDYNLLLRRQARATQAARSRLAVTQELLQQTYDEKSEISAKLRQTYDEKAERGILIKELRRQVASEKEATRDYKRRNKELKQTVKSMESEIERLKKSRAYRVGRLFGTPVRFLKQIKRASSKRC